MLPLWYASCSSNLLTWAGVQRASTWTRSASSSSQGYSAPEPAVIGGSGEDGRARGFVGEGHSSQSWPMSSRRGVSEDPRAHRPCWDLVTSSVLMLAPLRR